MTATIVTPTVTLNIFVSPDGVTVEQAAPAGGSDPIPYSAIVGEFLDAVDPAVVMADIMASDITVDPVSATLDWLRRFADA